MCPLTLIKQYFVNDALQLCTSEDAHPERGLRPGSKVGFVRSSEMVSLNSGTGTHNRPSWNWKWHFREGQVVFVGKGELV